MADTRSLPNATALRDENVLRRVRHLGSARDGLREWRLQRYTAVALIPLGLYFVASILRLAISDQLTAANWLSSPVPALLTILLVAALRTLERGTELPARRAHPLAIEATSMSEFNPPANSKVGKGKHWALPKPAKHTKRFQIYRWDPAKNANPQMDSSTSSAITAADGARRFVKINDQIDPTLSFRRSCREGVCGSCAMNIDGKNSAT